jgi:hypothetical protein
MTTHTRTHVIVTFADPYLTCEQCGAWVTSWHDDDRCGCDDSGFWNLPCEHQAGITSVCPSWSPVDGCQCLEHLGSVNHAEPPTQDQP